MDKLRGVLFVDDSVTTNFYNEHVFEEAGITDNIASVQDGMEALEFLARKGAYPAFENEYPQPDIIFLDINMPRMNGFDFLEAYKNVPKEQKGNLIIVMLSTSMLESEKERAMNYESVTDFWSKPIQVETLLKRIPDLLAKKSKVEK